jgi:hypothetical protein
MLCQVQPVWTEFIWLWIRTMVVSYEHSNEPSGSIYNGEFVAQLSNYQLPNKNSSSWSYLV